MDHSNLLIKNILKGNDDLKKFSDLFSNSNSLAIPFGLAISKERISKNNNEKYLKSGEVDNSLFEKLVNLISTDNYKPKVSIKDKVLSYTGGKQNTKRNKRCRKLNKSRKM